MVDATTQQRRRLYPTHKVTFERRDGDVTLASFLTTYSSTLIFLFSLALLPKQMIFEDEKYPLKHFAIVDQTRFEHLNDFSSHQKHLITRIPSS